MDRLKKEYYSNFAQLMGSTFLMFVFAATLGESTINLIVVMNDADVEKSLTEHAIFWVGAAFFTSIWCLTWVWFKKAEKICVDYWLSRKSLSADG